MKELSAYITANTVTDIFYVVRKHIKDKEALRETMQRMSTVVDVADVLKSDILKAFELDITDYEDALLARCAKRLKADYIITRISKFSTVRLSILQYSDDSCCENV